MRPGRVKPIDPDKYNIIRGNLLSCARDKTVSRLLVKSEIAFTRSGLANLAPDKTFINTWEASCCKAPLDSSNSPLQHMDKLQV